MWGSEIFVGTNKFEYTRRNNMSDTVILHISDLHFSSNENIKKEKENIMNSFIDILEQLELEWKPNVICISGDIVDKYDIPAYSIAKKWIEKLAKTLNVSIDNIIITPGNHDCSRDIKKYPKLDSDDEVLVDEVLNDEIPPYLSERFEAYENFCKELKITPYTWRNGDNYLVGCRIINDVIYLGCNTEWFAFSNKSKLRLGRGIVKELQQMSNELGDFRKVAVMHHGSEVGFHENEIQYHNDICPALHYLWKVCDMTLYGHSHEQIGGEPNKMENHCFTIKAGAISMDSKYPNNVNVIRINENSFELKYIHYNQQSTDQPWEIASNFSTYNWNNNYESIISPAVTIDIKKMRKKERLYAEEILNGKLRQVKTDGTLPDTILRNVVIDNNTKKHEEERERENNEKSKRISLIDLVLSERKVLVYGELGAGKSTIFSQLVINMLDNSMDYFPILISAKELVEWNDGKASSLLQHVCVFMQQQLLVNISSISEILECVEHCYLFVDGLDEVEKKKQEPLMRVLEQIPLMENRISVILSTRSTETIEYHRDNWTQCSLGRLHQQEILGILENEALAEENTEDAIIYAKKCFGKINNNPMVQLIATTPLVVRLLYHIMKKNIEIDKYTIGDMLNILFEERIAHWDVKNTSEVIGEEFERNFPTVDVKKNYIGYLAYCVENEKITRKKLELLIEKEMNIQNNSGLVVEQTISMLYRNGMAIETDRGIVFSYRPLTQLAIGIFFANKIIKEELQSNNCSLELWREVSFAAAEIRRADLMQKYRSWFLSYIDNLKNEAAGLVKSCYICYEAKDIELAKKMIDYFNERDIRPLWYYEPERNVSVSIVAQVIALSGKYGVEWFIDSYLNLTYPVINAGSAFFSELCMILPPLIKDSLTNTYKEKLQKCVEPLEYIRPTAYIRLPEVLCYLLPDKYSIERRLELIAKISSHDAYKEWAKDEYEVLCIEHKELCQRVLKNEKTFEAAVLWLKVFDDAPDINLMGKIIEHRDSELIEICRCRLGDKTYIRYLRWMLANSSRSVAASAALQLCSCGLDKLLEIRLALVGGMINANKHNCYEKKIIELIKSDGGLSKEWIKILFAQEHHIYRASEGSWRIFLRFLLETKDDLSNEFIKNLKYMGPFLLARCEEIRLLLQRLLTRQEYKISLIKAMNSLNPEIRHVANKIGLIACQDLEEECLYLVISECAGDDMDSIEWQNYVSGRKYQEKSIKKLSEKIPIMFPKMKVLAEKVIKFNDTKEKDESIQLTKSEMIAKELEGVAKYGISYFRRFINMLNSEVDFEDYLQIREKYKSESYSEVLYCFNYENQQYVVDWYRLLWFIFIGSKIGLHETDILMLELIEYGNKHPDIKKDMLNAAKRICVDERFERNRWISNYHWLLLLIYTFEGIEDDIIKDAFIQKEEYLWESSLALLAIYSGNLYELNIKKQNNKNYEDVAQIDCQNELVELAKESEIISKQLDSTMQIFIQEECSVSTEYIDTLIGLGENGALVAGVLCFCYGLPIRVESGMMAHQLYFLRGKVDSKVFLRLLRIMRSAFNSQLKDASKLEEYKEYIKESEARLEEMYLKKCFYVNEYFFYMKDKVTEEKILKYIDIAMDEMHYSGYATLVWDMIVEYIGFNKVNEQSKLKESMEVELHRIIGSCGKDSSYLYNEPYGQIAIACIFWKVNNMYVDLAQPVFERGIVQLMNSKNEDEWDGKKKLVDFDKLNTYISIVPKHIINQAIKCMKNSWLEEAKLLVSMIDFMNKNELK